MSAASSSPPPPLVATTTAATISAATAPVMRIGSGQRRLAATGVAAGGSGDIATVGRTAVSAGDPVGGGGDGASTAAGGGGGDGASTAAATGAGGAQISSRRSPAGASGSTRSGVGPLTASWWASKAAPRATACLGCELIVTGIASSDVISSAINGIRDEPPASTATLTSLGPTWAARSARPSAATVDNSRGRTRSSNSARVEPHVSVHGRAAPPGSPLRCRRKAPAWPRRTLAASGHSALAERLIAPIDLTRSLAAARRRQTRTRPRRSRCRRGARCPRARRAARSRRSALRRTAASNVPPPRS